MSYTNSPPKNKTTPFKTIYTSPFLSQMTKDNSLKGHHLVITGWASTILIIIIERGLWRRRGRRSKTCHASLSASNAAHSIVHVTHLINEIVKTTTKVSLHLLKLLHDGLEDHTTSRGGRRSGRGWNSRSCRIGHLHSWPLRLKLNLTLPDRISANGTYDGEERKERGMRMSKSWRIHVIVKGKMSLSRVAVSWYTSIIDVMKWKGKSIKRSSIKERRKRAWGLMMEL